MSARAALTARDLALALQHDSGDWLSKLFAHVDEVIEDHQPGHLKLPPAERSRLIGDLYAEVEKLP